MKHTVFVFHSLESRKPTQPMNPEGSPRDPRCYAGTPRIHATVDVVNAEMNIARVQSTINSE